MDNNVEQGNKPSLDTNRCDEITVEEKDIPKLNSSLFQLVDAIQKLDQSGISEMVMEGQKHYKGPLPLQVLEKLDKEQCDKIIDDMIQTKQKNMDNQAKFMDAVFKDQKLERLYDTIKYIFTATLGLGIFLTLVFTDNVSVLKEYLPYLFAFMGGSGLVLYNVSKKKNKTPNAEDKNDD